MAPIGYAKKMPVEISPSSAGAESNYAVKVTLVKGSGSNAAGVGYLDNQCLNWPNDIRWADNSGNELSFYREESDADLILRPEPRYISGIGTWQREMLRMRRRYR